MRRQTKGIVESNAVIRSRNRTDFSPDEIAGNFRVELREESREIVEHLFKPHEHFRPVPEEQYRPPKADEIEKAQCSWRQGQISTDAIIRQCFEIHSVDALNDILALIREERARSPVWWELGKRSSEEEDILSALWDYACEELRAQYVVRKRVTTSAARALFFTEFWKFVTVLPVAWEAWKWEYRKARWSRPTVSDFLSSPDVPRFHVEMRGKTKRGDQDLHEQAVDTYYKLLPCLRRTLKRTYRNESTRKKDLECALTEVFEDEVQFPEGKIREWASLRPKLPHDEIALQAVAHRYGVGWQYLKKQITAVRDRCLDKAYDSAIESLSKQHGGTGVSIPPPDSLFKQGHVIRITPFHPLVIFLYQRVLRLLLNLLERRPSALHA